MQNQWCKVALLLAALAIVSDLAAGEFLGLGKSKPDAWYELVTKKNHFTLEKLSKLLEIHTDDLGYYITCRQMPEYLASTMDKDKEGGVAGKYTVNQLLELNDFYSKDCTEDKIDERRKFCDELEAAVDGDPKFVHWNLHCYCRRTLDHFEDWCEPRLAAAANRRAKEEVLRLKLVKKEMLILKQFRQSVNDYIRANEVDRQYRRKDVIKKVFAAKVSEDSKQANEIREGCDKYIDVVYPIRGNKRLDYLVLDLLDDCLALVKSDSQ